MAGNLLQLFPMEYREFWKRVAGDEEVLQEIRLRADRPMIIVGRQGERFLDKNGNYTAFLEEAVCTSERELAQILISVIIAFAQLTLLYYAVLLSMRTPQVFSEEPEPEEPFRNPFEEENKQCYLLGLYSKKRPNPSLDKRHCLWSFPQGCTSVA